MLTWKEKLLCLLASLVINFLMVWGYVTFVKPTIDEAAKGIASVMLQNGQNSPYFKRGNNDRKAQERGYLREPK